MAVGATSTLPQLAQERPADSSRLQVARCDEYDVDQHKHDRQEGQGRHGDRMDQDADADGRQDDERCSVNDDKITVRE